MSLLTPLYVAAVLAVALPVLFHLLKRSPQKKQTFSSLMFLSPTLPRFARKSRISNWLLLLLRAAALTLLAIAFARPFFQSDTALAGGTQAGRYVAVLVDTSASMRRDDLWQQAKQQANDVLNTLGPADHAALFFFDRTVRPALNFDQWKRLDPAQRAAAFHAELEKAEPTWQSTSLGDAVAQAAEQVAAAGEPASHATPVPRSVVLISDLQQGGHADALQGHAWPETVRLAVRPTVSKSTANASLQLLPPSPDSADAADDRPRLRVSNAVGASVEQLTLAWASAAGPIESLPPQTLYVSAGGSQTLRIDWPPAGIAADRVRLSGDGVAFDNTLFVARPRKSVARVVFAGDDTADDADGLAFYLRSALGDTPQRQTEFTPGLKEPIANDTFKDADLLVVGRPMSAASASAARTFADAGGHVLWVLRTPADAAGLDDLLNVRGITATESAAKNYSLIARLDTGHPLLAPFADPRFGDFSRIHVWKHRALTWPAEAKAAVLATLDDGEPYLVEFPVGRGRVVVLTSGWQPADSQLALSSKFLPILDGLLRPRGNGMSQTQYFIGESPRLAKATSQPAAGQVRTPDGRTVPLAALSNDGFDTPGQYTIDGDGATTTAAVNLRPDESRLTPLAVADFKQWGAILESQTDPVAAAEQQRQLQRTELENRQKLWQWLLVGVLALLGMETALAGRLAKRGANVAETESAG